MRPIKVLGVAASIRSRSSRLKVKELISVIRERDDFSYILEKLSFERVASNSEACLIAGLYGSKKEGAEIDIIRLNKYFPFDYPSVMTKANAEELEKIVGDCDGIIIATPVYFGDRSSYAESFIKFLRERKLFDNKVVGVISVGAKRNGGQETTNVYTLWEVLNEGAFVVGNGPKTSQYGGTGWAGDLGAIREDNFGIETSIGVGQRVAQVAEIIKSAGSELTDNFKVSFWITKDRDRIVASDVRRRIEYLKPIFPQSVRFEVLDFTDKFLKRCIACNACPYHFNKSDQYGAFKDKIQNDDLKALYASLINTDAIIVASYNPRDTGGVQDIYQIFTERTRQIRRDNFILTNVPIASYSFEEVGQTVPFAMKVMTSYIRHNMVILPPITQYFLGDKIINDCNSEFYAFMVKAINIANGRKRVKPRNISYNATGYLFKDFDEISSYRK